jgi:hypothetical protein
MDARCVAGTVPFAPCPGTMRSRQLPWGALRMSTLMGLMLWLLLAVVSWPLALLALVLWPLVWLLLLPFRLLGIAVDGVFGLLRAVITLPARLLGGR